MIGRDITDRIRADEQLRLQAAMLQAAANSILIADRTGKMLWVNTAFTQLTGYAAAEAVGQNARLLKSGKQDAAFYARLWTTVLAGEVWHGELTNQRKDGTCYTEEMTITPVRDAQGQVNRFIAIKQDVTARHDLEESLRQSQKMESIGRLAGGIAHDFNNILQTILGFNELLLAATPATDARRGDLDEINKAARRAAELTHQLLAFSRRQTLTLRVLDVNYSLTETEKMLRRLLGEDVQLGPAARARFVPHAGRSGPDLADPHGLGGQRARCHAQGRTADHEHAQCRLRPIGRGGTAGGAARLLYLLGGQRHRLRHERRRPAQGRLARLAGLNQGFFLARAERRWTFSCLETGGRAKENLALSPCGRLLNPPFAAFWNKK